MPHKTRLRLLTIPGEALGALPDLKVLMLSANGDMGGAERSYCELLRHLPGHNIAPRACVPPESPLYRVCSHANKAPISTVMMRRFRRTTNPFLMAGQLRALHQSSKKIATICIEHGIQLIHANTDSAAVMAWEAARQIKLPFIWHCRDMRPMHGFAKVLGGAAAAVVPISATVREHLRQEGVRPEKLCLIYNGIDLTHFHSADIRESVRAIVREQLQIPMNRPMIICVASYVPWKRIDLFFESLRHLLKIIPGAMGILVGSDLSGMCAEHEQELERLRHELGLGDDVLRVLGHRDDVADLMAASDLLVSCSENEPFGRVLVEASASGLPVVCTHSGAKSEIIEPGINGVLVAPGDATAVAEACAVLLFDPALRERLGLRARSLAAERFNVKRTAEELANLFHASVPNKP